MFFAREHQVFDGPCGAGVGRTSTSPQRCDPPASAPTTAASAFGAEPVVGGKPWDNTGIVYNYVQQHLFGTKLKYVGALSRSQANIDHRQANKACWSTLLKPKLLLIEFFSLCWIIGFHRAASSTGSCMAKRMALASGRWKPTPNAFLTPRTVQEKRGKITLTFLRFPGK